MPPPHPAAAALVHLPSAPPGGCIITSLWALAIALAGISLGPTLAVAPRWLTLAIPAAALLAALAAAWLTCLSARRRVDRRATLATLAGAPHAPGRDSDTNLASALLSPADATRPTAPASRATASTTLSPASTANSPRTPSTPPTRSSSSSPPPPRPKPATPARPRPCSGGSSRREASPPAPSPPPTPAPRLGMMRSAGRCPPHRPHRAHRSRKNPAHAAHADSFLGICQRP